MGRSPCCDKNGLKKGPWTPEEDMKLIQYIQVHGPGNWRTLPKNAGLQRCGKSCRLRWSNYLRPDIKRGRFSFEEEETIIQLHSVLGNKWSAIAARLPGRTDNEIKNYWNTHIRKRLLHMGIDPLTDSPRLDLLDLSSLLNSPQLNISNLIRLQTLLNSDALRIATNLLASYNENPDFFLQKHQENQLLHSQVQNQNPQFLGNQLHNELNLQIPHCPPSNIPYSTFQSQSHLMQESIVQFPTSIQNFSNQTFEESLQTTASEGLPRIPSFCSGEFNRRMSGLSENSSFQSLNNSSNNSQNFSIDSVLSTSLSSSSSPLNSASTFVSGSPDDERESYRGSLLKFEIPESLDFDDFM